MMCPTGLPGHGKGTQAPSHGGGMRPFCRHCDGTGQSFSGQARETVLVLLGAGRGNISRSDGRFGFNGSLGVFSTGSRLSHRKAQFNFPTGKNIFPSWIFIFSQLGKFCEAFSNQDAASARSCLRATPNRLCRPVSDIAAALPVAGQQPPMPLSGKIRNFAMGLRIPSP